MSWDTTFVWADIAAQGALLALLIKGRAYRKLPFFLSYSVWCILSDLLGLLIQSRFNDHYFQFYLYEMPLDSLLQFGVLVELAWSVLQPLRSVLPRWTVFAIALLILLTGAAVWPLSGFTLLHNLPAQWHFLMRLQQTSSILRALFFLVLAAGSQVLSLGWKDRELQIATGLGVYSLLSIANALLHAQMQVANHYHIGDQIVSVSYLCSVIYWAACFAQKEAPRQAFSPQMQSFLLRVSGVAHANRIALENHSLPGDRRS